MRRIVRSSTSPTASGKTLCYNLPVLDRIKAIRSRAHVVVTNPDMLHKGVLPQHTKWVKLAEALVEQPVTLLDDNGAPRGERHFAIYDLPVVNRQLGIRRAALGSARRSVGL